MCVYLCMHVYTSLYAYIYLLIYRPISMHLFLVWTSVFLAGGVRCTLTCKASRPGGQVARYVWRGAEMKDGLNCAWAFEQP